MSSDMISTNITYTAICGEGLPFAATLLICSLDTGLESVGAATILKPFKDEMESV
jgi:hypothetical protein